MISGTNPVHIDFADVFQPPRTRYFARNPLGKWVEINRQTYDNYRRVYDAYAEGYDDVARLALAVVEV